MFAKRPPEQRSQDDVLAMSALAVPVAHSLQPNCLVWSWYVPAWQSSQDVCSVKLANVPARQLSQTVVRAVRLLAVPRAQSVQSTVLLTVA